MTLGEVDIVVVSFTECGDSALKVIEAKGQFFLVLTGFSGFEVEDQLLNFTNFENTLALINLEARRHVQLPFCGAFTDISENYGLFVVELHWNKSKVQHIWEVKDCTAALSTDWHDELLTLGDDHEVVCVVALSFGVEFDDVGDLHTGRNFGGEHIDVLSI